MSDTNTNGTKAPKQARATLAYDLDTRTLSVLQPKAKGGALMKSYSWGDYPANILAEATAKGLQEKFRDSYSDPTSDVLESTDAIDAQLKAGTWNVAGERGEQITVFHRAWYNLYAKGAGQAAVDFDAFVERVREMPAAKLASFRADPAIKLEMENVKITMAREKAAALKEAAKSAPQASPVSLDPFAVPLA